MHRFFIARHNMLLYHGWFGQRGTTARMAVHFYFYRHLLMKRNGGNMQDGLFHSIVKLHGFGSGV